MKRAFMILYPGRCTHKVAKSYCLANFVSTLHITFMIATWSQRRLRKTSEMEIEVTNHSGKNSRYRVFLHRPPAIAPLPELARTQARIGGHRGLWCTYHTFSTSPQGVRVHPAARKPAAVGLRLDSSKTYKVRSRYP